MNLPNIILILFLSNVVAAVATAVSVGLLKDVATQAAIFSIAHIISATVVVALCINYARQDEVDLESLVFNKIKEFSTYKMAAKGFLADYTFRFLWIFMFVALGLERYMPESPMGDMNVSGYPDVFMLVLCIGVFVPISEEILFRGFIYGTLRKKKTVLASALISSAVFGVLHIQPCLIIITFVAGLIYVWVYEKTGSLAAPISIHMVANSIAVISGSLKG